MFLHLGSDVMVPVREVLAIYDHKTMELDENKKMLETMMREKEVVEISKEAKSYVFTDSKIYLSVISSLTLKKRAQSVKAMMAEK
ncbi:MAG: DUF370 domain-containing protein [Selenomonadales bacterium]|nr:DUF370 domain-containing protein [Selenomonadales bacterium]